MKKILALLAIAGLATTAQAQFSTNFNDAAELANFDFLAEDNATNVLATIQAAAGVNVSVADYSTLQANSGDAASRVPEAPNSDVADTATTGLVINVDAATSPFDGVMATYNGAFPASGNYTATFDYFNAYGGGGGSTEFLFFGANTTGSTYIGASDVVFDRDGYIFSIAGDADFAGRDYNLGEGAVGGFSPSFVTSDATYIDGAGALPGVVWGDFQEVDIAGRQAADALFQNIFTTSTGPISGAITGQWVTVEVTYLNDRLSIKFNGNQIAVYDDPDDSFTSGSVSFGHEDSIFAGGGLTNYGIFDNFSLVEALPPSDAEAWNLYK